MYCYKKLLVLIFLVLGSANSCTADRPGDFTVCTQNLGRLGSRPDQQTKESIRYLGDRILKAGCDLVSVQENFGESKAEAETNLKRLVQSISSRSNAKFDYYLGDIYKGVIRNSFILRSDLGENAKVESFTKMQLKTYGKRTRVAYFTRAPALLKIKLSSLNESPKNIYVLNFHFKSKVDGYQDASNTQFESLRMQEADTLRDLALSISKPLSKDDLFVITGDRNSEADDAASDALEGEVTIADYGSSSCKISRESLRAICGGKKLKNSKKFIPLLEHYHWGKNHKWQFATYRYRKNYDIIDEILARPVDLDKISSESDIGVMGDFNKGSDHKLVYARFNLGMTNE